MTNLYLGEVVFLAGSVVSRTGGTVFSSSSGDSGSSASPPGLTVTLGSARSNVSWVRASEHYHRKYIA